MTRKRSRWPLLVDQPADSKRRRLHRCLDQGPLNFCELEDRRLLATFTVSSLADGPVSSAGDLPGSFRQAIFDANASAGNDQIEFIGAAATGTITLSAGELDITDSVTILGPSLADLTIDADGSSRVFHIDDNVANVNISGLTLTGGQTTGSDSGGAIRVDSGGELTLTDALLTGNTSIDDGGAISFASGSTGVIERSTFSFNEAVEPAGSNNENNSGGAIFNSGNLTIRNSTFNNNEGEFGGAILTIGSSSMLTIENSTFSRNSAVEDGGAIRPSSNSTTIINNSTVTGNWVRNPLDGLGGGVAMTNTATVTINSSIVSGNDVGGTQNNIDAGSGTLSGNFNLLGDGDTTGGGDDITVVNNPLLGPLSNNGGPTLTHAPLPGSQAINAGMSFVSSFDQRGAPFLRDDGNGVDIGAYERQSAALLNLVVDTTADENDGDYSAGDLSLREAIGLANGSIGADTITFSSLFNSQQTIDLSSQLPTISDSLIITGPGQTLLTLDAGGGTNGEIGNGDGFRIFNVDDHTNSLIDAELAGLALTGGDVTINGGAILNHENLMLTDSSIEMNYAVDSSGGGIHNSGSLSVTRSVLDSNFAGENGGGILNEGSLEVTDSTLEGNAADDGGGIWTENTSTITGSTLSGNYAIRYGGGIFNIGVTNVTNGVLSENFARYGGGIYNEGTTTVSGSTLSGNFAYEGGGILTSIDSMVTVSNSTLSENNAVNGNGGAILNSGTTTVTGSKIVGNEARNNGGGIRNLGTVTITNSSLSNNKVIEGDGGGINNEFSTAATVISSTLSGNSAHSGGGIYNRFGTINVTGSTLSGNTASFDGGGIQNGGGGTASITSSTITGNTAGYANPETVASGGGLNNSGNGTANITSSIVAGNTADTFPNVRGGLATDSLNLLSGDPMLGPLAFNGGTTKTHALLPGSPAIDAGTSLEAFDQRGATRIVDLAGIPDTAGSNGADIGAFERQVIDPIGTLPAVTSFVRDEGGVLARPDLLSTFAVTFDMDVNVGAGDLIIRNDTLGGTLVNTSALTLDYNSASRTATWDFSGLTLDPAFYSFELSSDIVSVVGNLSLDGDGNGNPGGAFIESVYVALPGDANLDGQVNVLGDAFALVGNLGTTGGATWAEGDFNDDGNVNVLGDAFALVGRLGQSVLPPVLLNSVAVEPTFLAEEAPSEPVPTTTAFAISPFSFLVQLEDDREVFRGQSTISPLGLAGAEDLDAAFESDILIDDGLF